MRIAFDLSILIHANYHIVKGFATKIDPIKFTDKIQKQAQAIILDIQKEYKITEFVFCADSKSSFRNLILPSYKENREHNEELDQVKDSIIEQLSDETDVLYHEGLEGDDMLFLTSRKNPGTIIVSQDNDCRLMLDKNTILYRQNKKEYIKHDSQDLEWVKVQKVLLGDKGDNVPKLLPKGKGEKFLEDMYNMSEHEKLSEFYKHVSSSMGIAMEDILQNISLTNYSMKIYQKYFDIQNIIDEIC